MDVKKFALSYYKNALDDFHIQRVEKPIEARKTHSHEYYQIYFVERGLVSHYIENTCTDMVAGDVFVIPPSVMHRIEVGSATAFYSVSFTLESITDSFLIGFLQSLYVRPKISLPSDTAIAVETAVKELWREFNERKIGCREIIKAYLSVILAHIARISFEIDAFLPSTEDSRQFIMHCVDYIDNNFEENITLDSMVKLSAMSKSAFCKSFSDVTGYSFNRYLNLCRIRKAASYIKDGYKITAVCGLCGYNDFSTFYRNFKSVMGTSPELYRKSLKS